MIGPEQRREPEAVDAGKDPAPDLPVEAVLPFDNESNFHPRTLLLGRAVLAEHRSRGGHNALQFVGKTYRERDHGQRGIRVTPCGKH